MAELVASEFELEIHEFDAYWGEKVQKEGIHPVGGIVDGTQVVEVDYAQSHCLGVVDKRIAEVGIVVVEVIDDRGRLGALLDSQPVGQGSGNIVAHHHL